MGPSNPGRPRSPFMPIIPGSPGRPSIPLSPCKPTPKIPYQAIQISNILQTNTKDILSGNHNLCNPTNIYLGQFITVSTPLSACTPTHRTFQPPPPLSPCKQHPGISSGHPYICHCNQHSDILRDCHCLFQPANNTEPKVSGHPHLSSSKLINTQDAFLGCMLSGSSVVTMILVRVLVHVYRIF